MVAARKPAAAATVAVVAFAAEAASLEPAQESHLTAFAEAASVVAVTRMAEPAAAQFAAASAEALAVPAPPAAGMDCQPAQMGSSAEREESQAGQCIMR